MISLSKFSHCANIAKYYGEYTDILWVLSLLCQKTRETCASFRYAFRVCLNAQKKSIQYMKPFDQKFSKLIQSENRWMWYKPKITVTDKKGRQALVDLIHAVNEIEFDEINIEISEQDTYIKAREETLQEVNEIYHAMLEEKTDTSCINVNFLDYKVSDFPFPVEYTRSAHYKTLEEYTRFSHVGNLVKEITGAEEFKKLCNLGILCNEITIDSIIWNFLFSYNLEGKIPEQFALMVQKVKLAKYEMEFTNVMKLRDIFPNLKEVAFDVELSSEEFNPQKLFSEAIQDGVSWRFYFSPKVKRKMKKPIIPYWRKGNPIELENVNVYYTFAENNYTVAFQAQKLGFDLGKAKILKSDSRFMTLETFECCELENISNYCNVDLEDYRDFSWTNSVSREVHPDHIVIEKKNFTFIGNPHYMLSIKPKEAKVIDLDLTTVKNYLTIYSKLLKCSIRLTIEKIYKILNKMKHYNSMTIRIRLKKSTMKSLNLISKLKLTHLHVMVRYSDLFEIDRKQRRILCNTILSIESMVDCTFFVNDMDKEYTTRNLTRGRKRLLPEIWTQILYYGGMKIPDPDFLDSIKVTDF